MKSEPLITGASFIICNADIPTGEIDGEMVALDLDQGHCFGIGKIGTAIWEMAAEPVQVDEIVRRLVEQYDVERGECLGDVLTFLREIREAGLVRVLPA
jgi:hypothetical protein